MVVGATLGTADHHFAADIGVAQRRDEGLAALAASVLDQAMRCERAAADSGDVHDVAFDTARTQICEAVLADPVAPDSGNRRGRFVAHRYFSSWCIDRCARGGLVAVLQFDARGFTEIGRASCRERVCQYV